MRLLTILLRFILPTFPLISWLRFCLITVIDLLNSASVSKFWLILQCQKSVRKVSGEPGKLDLYNPWSCTNFWRDYFLTAAWSSARVAIFDDSLTGLRTKRHDHCLVQLNVVHSDLVRYVVWGGASVLEHDSVYLKSKINRLGKMHC